MKPGIVAFMLVTVDGCVDSTDGAFDFWTIDDEFERFSDHQLETADQLLFGRVTFDQMATYWPSDQALANEPRTARLMNSLPKMVVSTTLHDPEGRRPTWSLIWTSSPRRDPRASPCYSAAPHSPERWSPGAWSMSSAC